MRYNALKRIISICTCALLLLFSVFTMSGINGTAYANEPITVKTFKILNGAQVKVSKDRAIRFTTTISKVELDGIIGNACDVKVVTLFTKKSTLEKFNVSDEDFTLETMKRLQSENPNSTLYGKVEFSETFGNLTENLSDDRYFFYACIYDIKDENIDKPFSARSYLEVDGNIVAYTNFNSENNSRDIADVIFSAIDAGDIDVNFCGDIFGTDFFNTVKAVSVKQTKVDEVIALINTLQSEDNIEMLDDLSIYGAYNAYSMLNVFEKEKVSNFSVLTSIKNAYDSKYVVIDDFSNIETYVVSDKETSYPSMIELKKEYDEKFGNILTLNFTKSESPSGKYTMLLDYFNLKSIAEVKLSSVSYVQMYVYHDYPSRKSLAGNFGGGFQNSMPNYIIYPNTWTLITVPVYDFMSGFLMGLYNIGTENVKFCIGGIYGVSSESAIKNVVEFIKGLGLPEYIENVFDYEREITIAHCAVSSFDENSKVLYYELGGIDVESYFNIIQG